MQALISKLVPPAWIGIMFGVTICLSVWGIVGGGSMGMN
jgi:hypothetical protein